MRRLRSLVLLGALALAVGAVAAGPAAAAKGGNNDTAKRCQKGGWKMLTAQTGAPFANQGDCVNDGAHGLGAVPPSAGATACANLTGSVFTNVGSDGLLWTCTYPVPPNPERPSALTDACASDGGKNGRVAFEPRAGGDWVALCTIGI
jgi:hypothetical protein